MSCFMVFAVLPVSSRGGDCDKNEMISERTFTIQIMDTYFIFTNVNQRRGSHNYRNIFFISIFLGIFIVFEQ